MYRLVFILLVFVLPSCASPSTASAKTFQNNTVSEDVGEPVLLNLNGYYILYMEPMSPFVSDGKVFVPIYRFTDLLSVGTKFTYGANVESAPISVVLSKGNIEVAINNKSIITITNTQTGEVTTPAYSGIEKVWQELKDNLYGIYIPLDIFKDAFNINIKYDDETATVYILEPSSYFTSRLDEEDNTLLYKVQPTPIIQPTKFSLEVTNGATKHEESAFRITLEIQAPDDFDGKAEDISVALLPNYEGCCYRYSGDSTIRPFICQNGTKKNLFICVENLLPEDQFKSPLQYIFSRIGVRVK
jgi:hypothetical protein